tara:strand:- start:1200 stop:1886 length:687 start_codon:yes stop_codon:yes gene_type:complete
MSKIIAYYRVSSKSQGESGLGLESQQAIVTHFHANNIIASYTDVASGKDIANREQLKQAIAHCKQEGATLCIAKLDRLSRSVVDCLNIFEELNGNILSCDIPGKLEKFIVTLFMAIAERERELIVLRTKQALQAKRERGELMGSSLRKHLGLKQGLTDTARKNAAKTLSLRASTNENSKRAINYAKTLHSASMSMDQVAQRLNNDGFKSPQGKQITISTVSRWLKKTN